MKGQNIFYSFLPSVTAAVLCTQPALANTVKVTGQRLIASPSVSNFTYDDISDAIEINTQLAAAVGNSMTAPIVPSGAIAAASLKSVSGSSVGVILTGKTGVPVRQVVGQVPNMLLDFKPTLEQTKLIQKIRSGSAQEKLSRPVVITEQKPQQDFLASGIRSKLASLIPEKILPFVQPTAEKTNFSKPTKPTETTTNRKVVEVAQLLEQIEFCPQEQKSKISRSASLLLTSTNQSRQVSSTCLPKNTTLNLAQAGSSTPKPNVPATRTPSGAVQVPDYLNPSPNPLQFPTKPEDVRIQGTQPITLVDALELARRNNRNLQQALLTLEQNRFVVREQQAALFPNASVSSGIARSGPGFSDQQQAVGRDLQGNLINQDISSTTALTARAQVQYNIYTSGSRQASIRAAEEQFRSAELEVERISEVIRLNVTTQYYDLQQADENVRIARSAVVNAQASLRDAQALERAGVSTRFDVLRSQVNLANAQQQLTNSLSQQRTSRRQLAQTLSLGQAVDISAAEPVRLAGLWNLPLDQTIVIAFQNRPELQQSLTDRNVAEQRRRQALAQLGPQVSFVGRYDLQDGFDDNTSIVDNYSVQLQANLLLFDGGASRARADQQRVNIRLAENQFADRRNQIRFEVEQAFSDLQANLDNVQTATVAVDQSREALRLARLRFQAGVGTQTEVIDAENDLTRSEGQRVQAILEYNRALARLQRATTSRASS